MNFERLIRILLISGESAAILVAALLFSLEIVNAGRIVLGVSIADLYVAGKTPQETELLLGERIGQYEAQPLTLLLPGQSFRKEFSPADLGVLFNIESTSALAFSYGRNPKIVSGVKEQVHALFVGKSYGVQSNIAEEPFQGSLSAITETIDQPAKNATLLWDEEQEAFTTIEEQSGVVMDQGALRMTLEQHAYRLLQTPLSLTLTTDIPIVTSQETEDAKKKALEMLDHAPYSLESDTRTWRITEETLRDMLVFLPEKRGGEDAVLGVTVDTEKLGAFLRETIAPLLNRPTQDAQLTVKNGRVTTFALSREGQELEMAASLAAIKDGVENLKETIELAVKNTAPRITTKTIDTLGLTSLLATGITDFAGSPKNRVHNIKVGAAKFHGILIPPTEEFSFVEHLGSVDAKGGYLPELVIKQDKTVPEYGGGLCQVSTTAFRAAVLSGLEITRRYSHSYIVRYYGTPGFDATIYPPNPDLRFRNDTPGHVLIQTRTEGTKLIFEFYGTNDEREVKIVGPAVFDKKPDGSAKATLTQEVWKDGELVRKKVFNSTYRSPNLYPVSRRNPLE